MRRLLPLNALLLISFCVAVGTLAGCGQKGPLVMPPPPTKPVPASASSTVKPGQAPVPASSVTKPAPAPVSGADSLIPNNEKPDSTQY